MGECRKESKSVNCGISGRCYITPTRKQLLGAQSLPTGLPVTANLFDFSEVLLLAASCFYHQDQNSSNVRRNSAHFGTLDYLNFHKMSMLHHVTLLRSSAGRHFFDKQAMPFREISSNRNKGIAYEVCVSETVCFTRTSQIIRRLLPAHTPEHSGHENEK